MRKLLLSLGLLLGFSVSALAQTACPTVGGVNNVNIPGITCAQEPGVPSYAATGVGIVPASAATDIACITGKAGVVVRLQYVRVSGSGTAISVPILITKHVSLNTGGTAGTGTALPVPYTLDPSNAAPGATTTSYTANPTIVDSTPGIIDNGNLGLVATTIGAAVEPYVDFNYINRGFMQAPILRAAAQQICVNLNGTSPTALLNVTFKWTEAPQ
jgi:hypothetical protein